MKPRPLPLVAGRFVGRRSQLRALEERLAEERLVTLLGPPGIGKTRCALAFASEFPLPTVFVDLAYARTEGEVLAAVGRALGMASAKDEERMAEAIGALGESLFILDNAEHVAPALAPLLRGWIREAPSARFLATSLLRLGIEEECCIELRGLEVEEALELFEDRASRVGAQQSEPVWIGRLLERLEGVPLAIELAAARTRVLSPRQLLARLDEGIEVLRGGSESERHRSLAASIRWSWELLEAEEAEALVKVSVFAGGFTLEAAEAVLGCGPSTLDLLERLRDKSFLRLSTEGEARFHMLESLRLYAQQQAGEGDLERDGPASLLDAARRRHALYFVGRADEGVDGIPGTEQLAWMLREEENLRAALAYARHPPEFRARACLALAALHAVRGPAEREAELLEMGVEALRDSGDAALRARLLRALGVVRIRLGELELARRLLEEGLRAARASARPRLLLHLGIEFGRLRFAEGDWKEARRLLGERIGSAGSEDEPLLRAYALNLRGMAAEAEGSMLEAAADFEEALDLFTRFNNRRFEAIAGLNLGVVRANIGRLDDAAHRFERAAEAFRLIEDRARETDARLNLGKVFLHQGRLEEAEPLLQEALAMERYIGNRRAEAIALDGLARLYFEKEEFQRALEFSRACRELSRRGELRHLLGAHLPFGAAIEAVMGNLREAEEDFEEARRLALSSSDPLLFETWKVLHALFEMARGQDASLARSCLEGAEERLRALPSGQRRSELELALRWLRGSLGRAAAPASPAPADEGKEVLTIGPEGGWFRLGSMPPVDLSKKRAPRLLLRALVERRLAAPGVGLSVDALAEVGWPGDRGHPSSRAARVYVAIHALRSLGLGERLRRQDCGYLLDPGLEIRRPAPRRPGI